MKFRNLIIIVYVFGFTGLPVSMAEGLEQSSLIVAAGNPALQAYYNEIVENNPDLQAAMAIWRSKAALVQPAGALPDPTLTVGVYLQEVETRVGPQQARLGISQGLPWKGKLKLKGDMAAAGAEAAKRRFEDLQNRLFSDFKIQVFRLLYLGRAIDVTAEHVALLQEWESLMQSRYTTDTAKLSDWIRVQVELSRLEDRLNTLKAAKEPVIEELNRILNRPSGSDFEGNAALGLNLPEAIPYTREQLRKAVSSDNPELKVLDNRVRERKFAISLSKKNFYPDFKVGLDFIQTGPARMDGVNGSGKDPVVLTFGLTLPLNRKKYRMLKMAASEAFVSATRVRVNRENAVVSRLALLEFQYEDAVRKLRLYRDKLIPDTRDSLTVTVRGYESGSDSFLDIIDTERTLLALELGMEQARADGLKALAGMERITTLPLVSGATGTSSAVARKSGTKQTESDKTKENR
ncbi:MAG: TolC family protein [Acidobacteria bacterium]|nr:TolC family protein [Acidobacteriota bacterium]